MGKRKKSSYIIQSVTNALDLLEEFRGEDTELGVTELSKRLGLHKNNVFRLLATLESRGYMEQNKVTGNYRLGLRVLELGQVFIKHMGLLKMARPILEEIVERANETAYLGVIRDDRVVYVDVVEATRPVRVVSRVGVGLPVYCSAVGKSQIAFESEDEVERVLAESVMKALHRAHDHGPGAAARATRDDPRGRVCHRRRGVRRGHPLRGSSGAGLHAPRDCRALHLGSCLPVHRVAPRAGVDPPGAGGGPEALVAPGLRGWAGGLIPGRRNAPAAPPVFSSAKMILSGLKTP